jgi:hypothetical protein
MDISQKAASEWLDEDLAQQLDEFAELEDHHSGAGSWPAEVYREVAKRLRAR